MPPLKPYSQRLKEQLATSHRKGYTTYPYGEHKTFGMKPIHVNTKPRG